MLLVERVRFHLCSVHHVIFSDDQNAAKETSMKRQEPIQCKLLSQATAVVHDDIRNETHTSTGSESTSPRCTGGHRRAMEDVERKVKHGEWCGRGLTIIQGPILEWLEGPRVQ